jgi:hypothetical protein
MTADNGIRDAISKYYAALAVPAAKPKNRNAIIIIYIESLSKNAILPRLLPARRWRSQDALRQKACGLDSVMLPDIVRYWLKRRTGGTGAADCDCSMATRFWM